MRNSSINVSCFCAQILQLKELDSDDIFCIVGSDGGLGSGASSVVRLAIQGAFGYVAVKCFNVHGGDGDKRKVVKKYVCMKVVQKFFKLSLPN